MAETNPSNGPKQGHLVVLVHGLWGTHTHVDVIAASVEHAFSEVSNNEICVLQPKSSTYFKTYDGVEVIGNRFLKEVYLEIEILKKESNIKITKFSIVGYSLGGLISRYIIGRLLEVGFFDHIQPIFFTTFATPHLGVKFFGSPISPVLNFLGSNLIGKSGQDLFLKSDILLRLSDPEGHFYKALELFKQRYLLCNIRHDRTVAFYTSFLTNISPFEHWDRLKLHFFNGIPEIQIAGKPIKPKIIDLRKTQYRSKEEPLPQPTLRSRLRYVGIVILIGFIIPFWFPVVLTANCVGSLLSLLRLSLYDTGIDNEAEWESVKKVLDDETYHDEPISKVSNSSKEAATSEDTDTGKDSPLVLHRTRTEEEDNGLSKELAGMTEGAIEGMLEATHRNEDLSNERDDILGTLKNVSTSSFANFDGDIVAGGFSDAVTINFKKHALAIRKFLSLIDNKQNAESDYPIFNGEEAKILPFDEGRRKINNVLNKLQWYKIPAYIDAFNAHDGIVSRRGLKSTPRGIATIYFWAVLLREQLVEIESEGMDVI